MIRLILIVLLLLTSLLTVIKAPTYNLWKLAIAAAEFAWVFIAITIVVLLSGFLAQRYTTTGTVLG
ncbi:MAG: alpha/beta hydrolase fold protein-3 domain protein, partial [Bacteroidetes bacterium]|nr:alpha/beta hydrolase fold protein-3 domain protein [Bacteroidota bacterium]